MSADVEPNAVVVAVDWAQSTLIGTVATSVAIIAVAWLGLMLMSGRLPRRRGAEIIVGCFIIFGASTIAAGLTSALGSSDRQAPEASPQPTLPSIATAAPASNPAYDPYAGAALPPRR